ncbi:hypothetical protein KL86DPRO_10367 [uncultured delta proteobacterium]|uniref:Uncharacterized protein n=1 Tax=uncultured delta proteobacterium TaxID=34034 RepID=A0A212IZ11_9DELT|nr:hypothetical protein KL86DPRO_10367 [uncultured delta proteobacterium]
MVTVYAKTQILENESTSTIQPQVQISAPGLQTTARQGAANTLTGPNPTTYTEDVMAQNTVNSPTTTVNPPPKLPQIIFWGRRHLHNTNYLSRSAREQVPRSQGSPCHTGRRSRQSAEDP